MRILTLAAALTVAFSGGAFAQTRAGGGSAEGNMNSPGSVKSNSQKMNEQSGGAMRTGAPGASGGPPVSTPGAAAGSGGGNGATGSGAAPSGK
ncbi:putative membrane protein [Methylobacterium persicinum]|uniref:Membrane protein n=2 Tax=Methylobacterium persicinum TaxID=374426 RepID=A0ABU0HSS3_9HYPH|nr:putative membrane protein [Methylobacterium persicinum]